jgi:uncharacterized membrane protein
MNALLVYLMVLRILHIVGGTAWVGGAIIYHFFVEPTAEATAPHGRQFVQYFVVRRRYPVYMTVSSMLTILSGALLFWHSSSGLNLGWLSSGPGLVFSLGSVLTFVAFGMGLFIMSPTAARMMKLGQVIQTAGGPPLPEQVSELHRLEAKMNKTGWSEFVLMVISLLTMATARYWLF